MKVEFSSLEADALIRHIEGLCALYEKVNSSGSGPLRPILNKIRQAAKEQN